MGGCQLVSAAPVESLHYQVEPSPSPAPWLIKARRGILRVTARSCHHGEFSQCVVLIVAIATVKAGRAPLFLIVCEFAPFCFSLHRKIREGTNIQPLVATCSVRCLQISVAPVR